MTEQYFHIEVLNREFAVRKTKNTRYSMRAYARDLGLSPSFLQEILKRKKGLSDKVADKIISALELSKIEGKVFKASVMSEHSRDKKKKLLAKKDLSQSKFLLKAKKFSDEDFAYASNWIYQAILEALALDEGDKTADWLATKLDSSIFVIEEALQNCLRLNWIEEKNGVFTPTFGNSMTTNDIPSAAIKKFHISAMEKSKQAILDQTVQERELQNCILAFPTSNIPEAKELIRNFVHDFNQKYSFSTQRDSVYQLSVQFVKLTK